MFEKFKELVNAPIKDGISGQASVVSATMPPDSATSANCRMRLTVQIPDHAPYNVEHQCMVKVTKWPWPGTTLPVTVDPKKLDHLRIEWDEVKTSREELDQSFPLYGSEEAAAQAQGATGMPVNIQGAGVDPAQMAQASAAVNAVLAQHGMGGQGVVDLRDKPEAREQMFAALEAQGVDTTQMRAMVAQREAAEAAAGGAPAPAPAAPPAPTAGDTIERLEKLGKLRDSGVLTPQEFEEQKRKVLGGE